jgi:isocitrate dehydrogenase kinase/phosphatase
MPDTPAIAEAARLIELAFEGYRQNLSVLAGRAQTRFEECAWQHLRSDMRERIEMRERILQDVRVQLAERLGQRLTERAVWAQLKPAYSARIAARPDLELAETFFSSATRRVFGTVGVDNSIEFTLTGSTATSAPAPAEPIYRRYMCSGGLGEAARAMMADFAFAVPYQNAERDARRVVEALQHHHSLQSIESIDVIRQPFFRGKGAYLVGRLNSGPHALPLVIALLNEGAGIFADAALTTEDEVSIIFSFTRNYFNVDVPHPGALIQFLKSIMPRKRLAELYIALGYNKHGKTELYRDVLRYLAETREQFEVAPGDRGMVMAVFTLPGYDLVFKVIRDTFAYPKSTTRAEVLAKYALVFQHDRAGRLVDAQEFREVAFPRERFSEVMLEELTRSCASSVTVAGRQVVIHHLYIERRVTPLNLYLHEAEAALAREAALDYGHAIKDLAATNVFPGDMLLKNFGVTRHGRVIFYDYDELCLVTDCRFRDLPQARDIEDELRAEAWYYVGENDIFPEEFLRFMGLQGQVLEAFLEAHRDLLTAGYWRQMQARHRAGEVMDIFPYRPSRRFRSHADRARLP